MINFFSYNRSLLPEYKTLGANCADISSSETTTIAPGEVKIVKTGLKMVATDGEFVKIYARSSLPIKRGLMLANGVAIIDSDYRGEMGMILYNFTNEPVTIEEGSRLCQLEVCNAKGGIKSHLVDLNTWEQIEEDNKTGRGSGGYGSTGL